MAPAAFLLGQTSQLSASDGAPPGTGLTLAVFVLVYAGMFLGRLPPIQVDRTGIVLLGAIALVASGILELEEATACVDVPTMVLLFSFMVLSAQLRLGGFYARAAGLLERLGANPALLLAGVIGAAAALSAVFTNDIVCLAIAPVLIRACAARRFDPVPFLLGLACAANVGSAATLIGNPQNILIGSVRGLSFGGYLAAAAPIAGLGLAATWAILWWQHRGRWESAAVAVPHATPTGADEEPPFDRWQTAKGLALAAILFGAFLLGPWRRDHLALGAAGLILLNTRMHSRRMLGLVDWQLLVMFAGLFVVNHGLESTGLASRGLETLARHGVDLQLPGWLCAVVVPLSNAVSNVPAVMLLLPAVHDANGGEVLAIASTFAGNLLVIGSVANVIVVEIASAHGIRIDWRRHARTGVPVTLATLLVACAVWWLRGVL
jgi:Na+/H+ antiporter NhaD/arsenite permease-like protein